MNKECLNIDCNESFFEIEKYVNPEIGYIKRHGVFSTQIMQIGQNYLKKRKIVPPTKKKNQVYNKTKKKY